MFDFYCFRFNRALTYSVMNDKKNNLEELKVSIKNLHSIYSMYETEDLDEWNKFLNTPVCTPFKEKLKGFKSVIQKTNDIILITQFEELVKAN